MEEEMKAQAQVWRYVYGFAESLTLKCAIQLNIPDILHKHNRPMTLSELATHLPLPTVDQDRLYRVMRYLVHMGLFDRVDSADSPTESLYSLNSASKLLVKGLDKSLASFALLQYYEMDAWHHLSAAVEGSATPWEKCHGVHYRDYFAKDAVANQLLSDAMTSHTSMVTEALLEGCRKSGVLDGVKSFVDVGGSTGVAARAVAKAFPGINCSVFDLPHVIATAPESDLVQRIQGDMFVSVPQADVVFMKSVLHDWGDEDCVKILKKCKEAIAGKEGGKVVILDIVLDAESSYEFKGARLGMEMDMLVTVGGKERSEAEWQKLIKDAGYSRYKIIPIVAIESIIEVFP